MNRLTLRLIEVGAKRRQRHAAKRENYRFTYKMRPNVGCWEQTPIYGRDQGGVMWYLIWSNRRTFINHSMNTTGYDLPKNWEVV